MDHHEELCVHYGMTPSRNNRGVAHENGSIESSHGTREQATSCCCVVCATSRPRRHRCFIDEVIGRRNARNRKRIEIERAALAHSRPKNHRP